MTIPTAAKAIDGVPSGAVKFGRLLLAVFGAIVLYELRVFKPLSLHAAEPVASLARLAWLSAIWLGPAMILYWGIARDIFNSTPGSASGFVNGEHVTMTVYGTGAGHVQKGSPKLALFVARYVVVIVPLTYVAWPYIDRLTSLAPFGGVPMDAVLMIGEIVGFFVLVGVGVHFMWQTGSTVARGFRYAVFAVVGAGMALLACWNLYFLGHFLLTKA